MKVKVKIWIEDNEKNLIFGGGKTQILEFIDQSGSISKAAEMVGMNYKKAWSHIKILKELIDDELVIVQKGRTSGGTVLTSKAKELIKEYKQLELDVKDFAVKRFEELFEKEEQIIQSSLDVGNAKDIKNV